METSSQPPIPPILRNILQQLSGGFNWTLLAGILVLGVMVITLRIDNVSGEHVGVLLNRLTGGYKIVNTSGVTIYNGLVTEFYLMDRTLHTLEMSEDPSRGDRKEKDDLKVKTIDGSDVYVDLKVQYRIIPEMADVVLSTAGPGDSYKRKWIRDYVRSITRNHLGELTTEEFYDSSIRAEKTSAAKIRMNQRLETFGVRIDSLVIPKRPHFYKEYEDIIKKKKLADQDVLQEQSKALAAKQKQHTMIVLENNKKNVAVEEFTGAMRQLVIEAEAEAEKAKRDADGYFEKTTVAAAANFYQQQQAAEGILARKSADAEGILALRKALAGDGGRNMVKLEYAKRLKDMKLTGKPYTIDNSIERFEHSKGAASIGRD